MNDSVPGGRLKKIFFEPWGLRAGWRLLIFNVAFNLFGVLMKLILVPIVGKEPEWTVANFILIEIVSLAGSAACVYLMTRIERRRFADYGFTIIFPVLAVLFAAFHFRYRAVKYPVDGRRGRA